MNMLRCLRSDMRRAFGINMLLIAIGTVAVQFLSLMDFWGEKMSLIYALDVSTGIGKFQFLAPSVACLGFANAVYVDMKSGYDKFLHMRCGYRNYCVSKCIACGLSAFCGVALGMAAFFLSYYVQGCPLIDEGLWLYSGWSTDRPLAYIASRTLYRAIAGSAWSMLGLFISVYMPNPFVIRIMPFIVVYMATYVFNTIMGLPSSIYSLECGTLDFASPAAEMGAILAVFLTLAILFALAFAHGLKRRYRNG